MSSGKKSSHYCRSSRHPNTAADLPKQFPSPSTCWRRLRDWEEQDIWLDAWRAFLAQLDQKGRRIAYNIIIKPDGCPRFYGFTIGDFFT
ncbi:MAG: transposase [Planctomycetes bacterium]|nr:transposase [Planctomycetota bacterium]